MRKYSSYEIALRLGSLRVNTFLFVTEKIAPSASDTFLGMNAPSLYAAVMYPFRSLIITRIFGILSMY
jgi:hypothetical protein